MTLLKIENLKTTFYTREGDVKAVNRVDLMIEEGEKLALIGETGSGKSVLGLSIMGLLPDNARVKGRIFFKGEDMLERNPEEMRKIRGRRIAYIPQNPGTSLNPIMKVGQQVKEAVINSMNIKKKRAGERVLELFKSVKLSEPEKLINQYPHQLSGGMKQRVLFSMGMAGSPELLIADEPAKGLDAPLKAQTIKLLGRISSKTSMLLITHDLKATRICNKVAVMYAGEIIEYGRIEEIFENPRHPYTQGLVRSLPEKGFIPIEGVSPSLISLPQGCRFYPRCQIVSIKCRNEHPGFKTASGRFWRCFNA
ncbi:oligopeptide transport ATP-binding protein OppD [archaeon]|nr:oligopeptide transport ATP-binding protein OppD [archaeon]